MQKTPKISRARTGYFVNLCKIFVVGGEVSESYASTMNAGTAEKSTKTRNHADRSECPIAWALDVIGDRWTLLVIRDLMFMGKRQFGQFLESGERMPTNILADRLRRLSNCGLISKTPYQTNPVRYQYELTEKGAGLRPTMETLGEWAAGHLCSERGPAEDCQ